LSAEHILQLIFIWHYKSVLPQVADRLHEVWVEEQPSHVRVASVELEGQQVHALLSEPRLHRQKHFHLVFVVRRPFKFPWRDHERLQAPQISKNQLRLRENECEWESDRVEHGQQLQRQVLVGAPQRFHREHQVGFASIEYYEFRFAPDPCHELVIVPLLDKPCVFPL
jgi:hypothetical protein